VRNARANSAGSLAGAWSGGCTVAAAAGRTGRAAVGGDVGETAGAITGWAGETGGWARMGGAGKKVREPPGEGVPGMPALATGSAR
jgi:hypothetical protein